MGRRYTKRARRNGEVDVTMADQTTTPAPQQTLTDEQKLGLALVALLTPAAGYALGGKQGAYAGAAAGAGAAGKGFETLAEREQKAKAQQQAADLYEQKRSDKVEDAGKMAEDREAAKAKNRPAPKPAKPAPGAAPKGSAGAVAETPKKEPPKTAMQIKKAGLAEIGEMAESQYQAAIAKGQADGSFNPTDPKQFIDASRSSPEWMKSDAANEAMAAADSWIDSYLRDESGAAIPPDEKAEYYRTYFPQKGDTAQTVANKTALRRQKMAAARAAGGAPQPEQKPYAPGTVVEYQGKRYTVADDGDSLIEIPNIGSK